MRVSRGESRQSTFLQALEENRRAAGMGEGDGGTLSFTQRDFFESRGITVQSPGEQNRGGGAPQFLGEILSDPSGVGKRAGFESLGLGSVAGAEGKSHSGGSGGDIDWQAPPVHGRGGLEGPSPLKGRDMAGECISLGEGTSLGDGTSPGEVFPQKKGGSSWEDSSWGEDEILPQEGLGVTGRTGLVETLSQALERGSRRYRQGWEG